VKKLMLTFSLTRFFVVRFVAKRYRILYHCHTAIDK